MFSSLRAYHTDKLSFIRIVCLVAFFASTEQFAFAQNTEAGLELGSHYYLGDVNRSVRLGLARFGGQAFYRQHLNEGISVRYSAGIARLVGSDDVAFDVFSANRQAYFSGTLYCGDVLMEYHFLNYRDEKARQYWTPYVFFGLGLYQFNGEDNLGENYDSGIKLRLPAGVGLKYRIDRRWTVGISLAAIKTNSDMIDNISGADPSIKNYRGGNPNDDDWMFYSGISLSYTFYKIVCPQRSLR